MPILFPDKPTARNITRVISPNPIPCGVGKKKDPSATQTPASVLSYKKDGLSASKSVLARIGDVEEACNF